MLIEFFPLRLLTAGAISLFLNITGAIVPVAPVLNMPLIHTLAIKSISLYSAPQIHDPRDLLPTEPIPQNLSNEAITEHPNETKNEANTTESISGDPNAGESQVEQVQVAYIHDPNGANGQNTENTG